MKKLLNPTSLINPIPFNRKHENMMRMLQTFVYTNKLRIHPEMEDIIIALKSAKNNSINRIR